MNNDRIEWVDIAKGIGQILVIAGHLFRAGSYISCVIFAFHMPLFFFLSGLFFKEMDFSTLLKKKFHALLIPFLKFALLGAFITLIVQPFTNEKWTIRRFLYDIYQGAPNSLYIGQIWFLLSLFWINIIAYIAVRICKSDAQRYIVLMTITGGGYILERVNIFLPGERFPWMFETSVMGSLFFLAGFWGRNIIVIFEKKTTAVKETLAFLCLAVVLGFSEINGWVNIAIPQYGNPFLYVIFAFSGICFTIVCSKLLLRSSKGIGLGIRKMLAFLGENSMLVFALHSLPVYGYCFILKKLELEPACGIAATSGAYSAIGTILIVAVMYIGVYIFRHWPDMLFHKHEK